MFTGIVQQTAAIISMSRRGGGASMKIESPWRTPPAPGESVSVNGSCLTVVSANEREISFDLSGETLKKTIFSSVFPGARVNLERSLKVGDYVSGHFVTGHVDGVGTVVEFTRKGAFAELSVKVPAELAVYIAPKGSVAVNGVSLTIASLEGDSFVAAVIPETIERTNLAELKTGSPVNIEADLIGKHVVRYLSTAGGAETRQALTLTDLEEKGY
jgi:riboflavin synthase alpha subunit